MDLVQFVEEFEDFDRGISLDQFIKKYCNEIINKGCGHKIHRGSNIGEDALLPDGFEPWEDLSVYPDRLIWKADKYLTLVRYSKGDIVIHQHDRRSSYYICLEEAIKKYSKRTQNE